MRFARVAAAATAVSLVGAATLVSPAKAATSGVGTSAASSSLLNVAVGTAGSVLNLKVLADEARSTIDPSVATPEAFSRLNALSLTSSLLPSPLNNVSLPVVESRTPGGSPAVAGPALDLSSIGGVALPVSVLDGVLTPASLTSAVDGTKATSALTSSLANVSLVGGLVKAAGLESKLGTTAATGFADGSRTIKAGTINVLDLGALLNGLGIPLSALPIDAVSDILATLGVPVAGLPTSLTLESFVAELNSTIDAVQAQVDGAGATIDDSLTPAVGGILGGLNLPVPTVGDAVAVAQGVIDDVQAIIADLLETALGALDGLSLLKVGGVEVGTVTKAVETVDGSTADIVAKIGSISVGGLDLPGLDLGATLTQVNGVVSTINGTVSSVLGSISPDLANLVKVSLFEKDSATGVSRDGGYVKSLAGVTALTASITPPLNLDAIVSGLVGTAGIGSVLTAAGGSLPVLDTVMTTLNGLLGSSVEALSGGATVKLASVTSGASFTTPVAASGGALPRTGGTAQNALVGMALVIAAMASRRFVLTQRAQ
ncbi:MAG TPA: hypothetical protein VMZ22_12425 [Acidimicrobiales bacterium]|nr:hypothetical protein [Acidimicrobiales bacterium]